MTKSLNSRFEKRPPDGWVNVYKPVGMTSAQCVARVKKTLRPEKVGHGGTLDPLAEGVLPLALGEATKLMGFILDANKTYCFTVQWGQETTTDDAEGEALATSPKRPTVAEIEAVLPQFERAYALAREGKDVQLPSRTVTIHQFKLIPPTADDEAAAQAPQHSSTFVARVSKGTYVRALARDMGRALGCYGFITKLVRTQAGPFGLDNVTTLEMLDNAAQTGDTASIVLPPTHTLADTPVYHATAAEARILRLGQPLCRLHVAAGLTQVHSPQGSLLALVEVEENGTFITKRVFNTGAEAQSLPAYKKSRPKPVARYFE